MSTFVNRTQELAFLDSLLTRTRPGPAQLVLLYGRRRVGKTVLLRHWAATAVAADPSLSFTYWVAEKEPAALQRRKLLARILDVPLQSAPMFSSWEEVWASVANLLGDKRHILILDELPYAARPTRPCYQVCNMHGTNTSKTRMSFSSCAAPTCARWRRCSLASRRFLAA